MSRRVVDERQAGRTNKARSGCGRGKAFPFRGRAQGGRGYGTVASGNEAARPCRGNRTTEPRTDPAGGAWASEGAAQWKAAGRRAMAMAMGRRCCWLRVYCVSSREVERYRW